MGWRFQIWRESLLIKDLSAETIRTHFSPAGKYPGRRKMSGYWTTMTSDTLTALLYLLTGAAIIYLFKVRRTGLSRLENRLIPELSAEDFAKLLVLLKTAYERMLYMGILFLPLAFSTFRGGDRVGTLFFLLLIGLLFLSNIGPRHKIMRLLEEHGLSVADLKERGITL